MFQWKKIKKWEEYDKLDNIKLLNSFNCEKYTYISEAKKLRKC